MKPDGVESDGEESDESSEPEHPMFIVSMNRTGMNKRRHFLVFIETSFLERAKLKTKADRDIWIHNEKLRDTILAFLPSL